MMTVGMETKSQRTTVLTLACAAFLGAFLLFSMEILAGRMLSHSFGGSAHVWLFALTFFNLMLVVGYLLAHLLVKKRGQWHLLLLLAPMPLLPFFMPGTEAVNYGSTLSVLSMLARQFALPFAILSTTAVMAQTWLVHYRIRENPFFMYSVSNAGALLALAAYPWLIEPLAGIARQSDLWAIGYALYAALMTMARWRLGRYAHQRSGPSAHQDATASIDAPGWKTVLSWTCLSAITSAFLLTATHLLSFEIGSFPLVWTFPLMAYLVSFMVVFHSDAVKRQWIPGLWPEIVILGLFFFLVPFSSHLFVIAFSVVFFLICRLAHQVLYEGRPTPDFLSLFYLAIALGGLLGSAGISFVAPLIFPGLWEYPLLLAALAGIFHYRYRTLRFRPFSPGPAHSFRWIVMALSVGMIIFMAFHSSLGTLQASHRNDYGIIRVMDSGSGVNRVRSLVQGSTLHGIQYLDRPGQATPTLYYHAEGGLADAFALVPPAASIAAVGMGVGTVAAYTRQGDVLDFFEINPDLEALARRWFTFLAEARAQIRIIHGDGRYALEKKINKDIRYDLIFIDAFSGEGIPTHLLTKEALQVYVSRLQENGTLIFHLTNRYYDLLPVIRSTSSVLGLYGAVKKTIMQREEHSGQIRTDYVILVKNRDILKKLPESQWTVWSDQDHSVPCRPWTDDYVNILVPLAAKIHSH